jgi:SPP1 gp7 family putative phage head morphogenesis protein
VSALQRLREAWHAAIDPDTAEKGRQAVLGEVALADSRDRLFTNPTMAFYKYNPSLLVRRKGFTLYEQMANDDQLKAALTFKRYAVLASGWEVVAPEGKPKDWEPKVVVDSQLKDLDNTLEHALDEVLSSMTYGFSLSEKNWVAEGSYLELGCLKTIHPRDILFEMDGYGNIERILQGITIELPQEKFLHFVHDGRFRNPYGESDFNAAYRAWWVKDNTYKWMAMLLERMGIPPVFALYDANALSAYVGPIKDALASIQAGTYGALPRGKDPKSLEMWAPRLAENVDKVFIPALDRFDKDMARAILLPGLIGYTPDASVGSQARATVHFDAFIMVVEKIRTLLAARMNEDVVEDIVDFNFASVDEYPRFRFLPLSDEVKDTIFKLWVDLLKEGAVRPQTEDEDHIRASLKFPEQGGTPMAQVLPGRPTIIGPDGEIIQSTPPPVGEAPPSIKEPPPETGGPEGETPSYAVRGPKGYLPAYRAYVAFSRQTPVQAARIMEKAQTELVRRIGAALRDARDTLVEALRRDDLNAKFVDTLRLRKLGDVQGALQEVLRAVWAQGSAHRFEFTPQEAAAYLQQKALHAAGVVRDDLTNDIRQVLLNAIKTGTPLGDVVRQLDAAFEPYLGGPGHLADAASPSRLETLARTNITDAYNQGRISMAKDPDVIDMLAGMRYSAVLDDRTTEICQFLNDKVFEMDDPALEQLAPPNHFNCRSILVPVTKGEAEDSNMDSSDFVTAGDVGQALEMRGSFRAAGAFKNYREN